LTPLDYFLWGTVKDECYESNQPETIQELKMKSKLPMKYALIQVENVLKNWVDRMEYVQSVVEVI